MYIFTYYRTTGPSHFTFYLLMYGYYKNLCLLSCLGKKGLGGSVTGTGTREEEEVER